MRCPKSPYLLLHTRTDKSARKLRSVKPPPVAAREPLTSPAVDRYLLEGNTVLARQNGDRKGYPPGGQGMKLYLKAWDDKWMAMSSNA